MHSKMVVAGIRAAKGSRRIASCRYNPRSATIVRDMRAHDERPPRRPGMHTDTDSPVTTFVLVPEQDLGHAIAKKLREDPRVQVCGVSTDPEKDMFRIWDADPDVIVADFEAGGLEFLYSERLPPGKHRVVFFAPRSEAGCDACYEALVQGAQGIMCRPDTAEKITLCSDLARSVREGAPMRPADCPAVERLQREEKTANES